jgi:hypothetical protein
MVDEEKYDNEMIRAAAEAIKHSVVLLITHYPGTQKNATGLLFQDAGGMYIGTNRHVLAEVAYLPDGLDAVLEVSAGNLLFGVQLRDHGNWLMSRKFDYAIVPIRSEDAAGLLELKRPFNREVINAAPLEVNDVVYTLGGHFKTVHPWALQNRSLGCFSSRAKW